MPSWALGGPHVGSPCGPQLNLATGATMAPRGLAQLGFRRAQYGFYLGIFLFSLLLFLLQATTKYLKEKHLNWKKASGRNLFTACSLLKKNNKGGLITISIFISHKVYRHGCRRVVGRCSRCFTQSDELFRAVFGAFCRSLWRDDSSQDTTPTRSHTDLAIFKRLDCITTRRNSSYSFVTLRRIFGSCTYLIMLYPIHCRSYSHFRDIIPCFVLSIMLLT